MRANEVTNVVGRGSVCAKLGKPKPWYVLGPQGPLWELTSIILNSKLLLLQVYLAKNTPMTSIFLVHPLRSRLLGCNLVSFILLVLVVAFMTL